MLSRQGMRSGRRIELKDIDPLREGLRIIGSAPPAGFNNRRFTLNGITRGAAGDIEAVPSDMETSHFYRVGKVLYHVGTRDYESKYDAANHLLSWLLTAEYSGIGALRDIIKLVDNHFDEILNWFDSGMSNGVVEGINSVIQGVKSRAR